MSGCCGSLKPRWKRLVDNIFPDHPEDGLVRSNMEKLTYYSLSAPEKLDRIGDYLGQRLSRDVQRHKKGFVRIAMEAMDVLLVACHAQQLNLFVESYLKMIQKLLECDDPELQVLATTSFVKFSNIEEDTPSYHRRYDFFVSRFSTMCHSNRGNQEWMYKIRVAGLRGIQGVVRKTITDELQVNIWDQSHMDKIVPSLLFNMQEGFNKDSETPKDDDHPSVVSENVFRDLVCRATFGSLPSALKPVLTHLDNHQLWNPNDFAVKVFKIIMYSVQAQYGYQVVQMLMNHLNGHSNSGARLKASITDVLSQTVIIAAGGSIGPSVLEVFNSLLRHLRVSVETKTDVAAMLEDERRFQEAIINTIGEFAKNLPDYQKIEIMMFVLSKIPMLSEEEALSTDSFVTLQTMLLKTMLKVATKYKTTQLGSAFPSALLEPLLRMSLAAEPQIRLIVEEILHTLIDRHGNTEKLNSVRLPKQLSELDLQVDKPQTPDLIFMKKHGKQFYWCIQENISQDSNHVDNFEAVYCTMALLVVEAGGEEVVADLIGMTLSIQKTLTTQTGIAMTHQCAIHAIIAAFFNLIGHLIAVPAFSNHVSQILELRETEAPHLLPEFAFNKSNSPDSYPEIAVPAETLLFDSAVVSEALGASGWDTSRLTAFINQKPGDFTSDATHSIYSDINSIQLELDSAESSPGLSRKKTEEDITFESLKRMLSDNSEETKRAKEEKRMEILDSFKNAPFENLMAKSEAKADVFNNKLNQILDMISKDKEAVNTPTQPPEVPITDIQFPDLFVY